MVFNEPPPFVTDVYEQMPLPQCKEIRIEIEKSTKRAQIEGLFSLLLKNQPVIGYEYSKGHVFWRGRVCKRRRKRVESIWHPKAKCTRINRFNRPAERVLYASSDVETVGRELNASIGTRIQLIGISIKAGEKILIRTIGDLERIYRTQKSLVLEDRIVSQFVGILTSADPAIVESIIYVDSFFGNILADPKEINTNYLRSLAFKEALRIKLPSTKCFYYPSVANRRGVNIACEGDIADADMEVVSAAIARVTRVSRSGVLEIQIELACPAIETNGTFIWQKPNVPNEIFEMNPGFSSFNLR